MTLAVFIVLFIFLLFTIYWFYQQDISRRIFNRLFDEEEEVPTVEPEQTKPFYQKNIFWLPWVFAVLFYMLLHFLWGVKVVFSFGFSFVLALLLVQFFDYRFIQRMTMIEEQLADTVDLMISNLRAGVGATAALETALEEVPRPLYDYLSEVVGRLKFGDNPEKVFRQLGDRVPLESFKIFSLTMSVHWGSGGRLVPLLATVGKTIRNRIEISRQIRMHAAQSKLSMIALVLASYFIAFTVWRSDPVNFEAFLLSIVGSWLVAFALVMQGVGILWISKISKIKY